MKPDDKKALIDWEEFVRNQNRDSPVDYTESRKDQQKRIAHLEANPEEWFKYYFGKFYSSEATKFHIDATKRLLKNSEWYEVRAWSRELAKSIRTMMEDMLIGVAYKRKRCFVEVSNNHDDAVRLLSPYKSNLEKNERLIHDYGVQEGTIWTKSFFVTKTGISFLAVGVGESPRGFRNEEIRPDKINIDDFDTDQDCRNPDMVDSKWEWFEGAVYGMRSISNDLQVIFNGNIIAEYSCIKKAMEMADYVSVVNIRDEYGKSTWPQKNTEARIDRALSKISYAKQQQEYFNNPITNGKVFKQLNYKKLRPLSEYRFLVLYTDPSYKAGKKNDFKATALIGKWRDEYHVLRMFCAQTSTANMIDWQYEILKEFGSKIPIYFLIEWPSIDDTLKLEIEKANKRHGVTLPLRADERVKPEKFYRIESLLEPLNRNEKLWFAEELKSSQHMKDCEAQFLALSQTSRAHDDGPDAVEGGVFEINRRTIADPTKVQAINTNRHNPKRF